MKKGWLLLLLLVFVFSPNADAADFNCWLEARGLSAEIIITPEPLAKLSQEDIEAEVRVESTEQFRTYHDNAQEVSRNCFEVYFSAGPATNSVTLVWETEFPRLIEVVVKITAKGQEEIHTLSFRDAAVILTLIPDPELSEITQSISNWDWAILYYDAEYQDQGRLNTYSWRMLRKEELVQFLSQGAPWVGYVMKPYTLKGTTVTLSVVGGRDHQDSQDDRFVYLSQTLHLEKDAPDSWTLELKYPAPTTSKPIDQDEPIITQWGFVKHRKP